MAHENSETVKRDTPKGPRWFVIDTVGANAGEVLIGGKLGFLSREAADRAAKRRSDAFQGNPIRRALDDAF